MFLPLPLCAKSSEVLVSLVSCTINTESVLNLRTTKGEPLSTAPVPCTTCDERCSVQCTCCNVEVLHLETTGMLRQQYDTSAVVCRGDGSNFQVGCPS